MSKYDGGSAFPIPIASASDGCIYNTLEQSSGENGGMTLRDYFAAKAMQALISGSPTQRGWLPYAEETAYLIADAMIAERSKP